MKNKNDYLKIATEDFVIGDPPSTVITNLNDTARLFKMYEIVHPTKLGLDGRPMGFRKEGAEAVVILTEILLRENPAYARGSDFQKLRAVVEDELISAICNETPHVDSGTLEAEIATWFSKVAVTVTHFIPCSISPNPSQSFHVGPVKFHPLAGFHTAYVTTAPNEINKFSYGQALEYAVKQGAHWMAEIKTDSYDSDRSGEHADIAVDIALVALQLFIPSSVSKEVARSTARAIPSQIGTFQDRGGYLRVGHARVDPCLSYSAGYFDQLLRHNKGILDSVGNRVEAFVSGQSTTLSLDQAWCDAAYWFHEGIAEKLNTVAITKLETCIEVLLSAQSSKGSKDQLLKAFQSFYNLSSKQPLSENGPRTVQNFIDSMVTARSRVLHGTWSTLNYRKAARYEHQDRGEIEWLARDLLARFTLHLDNYKKTEHPEDDIVKFLDWIATSQPGTQIPS